MGWNNSEDLHHRATNGMRFGHVSGDIDFSKKLPVGKVEGGDQENEVTFLFQSGQRVNYGKGEKIRAITFDPEGDASKRVAMVFGPQEKESSPKPGEQHVYEPGNPDNMLNFKSGGQDQTSKGGNISVASANHNVTADSSASIKAGNFNLDTSKASLAGMIKIDGSTITLCGIVVITPTGVTINGNLLVNGGSVGLNGTVDLNGTVAINGSVETPDT